MSVKCFIARQGGRLHAGGVIKQGAPRSYRRREVLRFGLGLAGLAAAGGCGGLVVPWQAKARVPRIGYLALTNSPTAQHRAFREGLQELGYVEGQTIGIEERWADAPDQLPSLAAELVGLPVDVLVAAGGGPSVEAAKSATSTIPVVFTSANDPVRAGLVASLARPGGNITGLSILATQVQAKRLQLLREIVPGFSRAVLLTQTASSRSSGSLQESLEAAQSLGVQLLTPDIQTAEDLPAAFQVAQAGGAEVVWVTGHPLIVGQRALILSFATGSRLPLLSEDRSFPDAGGLTSYGASRTITSRRAAAYVDRILKGARPADLPVEQPTELDFIVNLKTAQNLGLTIPPAVLAQVTEVIQ